MMFIKRLDISSSVDSMNESLNEILSEVDWGDKNQIGLNYRKGAVDTWHDGSGSLYDRDSESFTANEGDFTEWNKLPAYLKAQLKNLIDSQKINVGRVRFMRLAPKTGLSVHRDREFRYHFVLKTNQHSYIYQEVKKSVGHVSDVDITGISYHLPADGNWYKVDTTQVHYVYNGGTEDRIHLVVCG